MAQLDLVVQGNPRILTDVHLLFDCSARAVLSRALLVAAVGRCGCQAKQRVVDSGGHKFPDRSSPIGKWKRGWRWIA